VAHPGALHCDAAFMHLDQVSADREPETRTAARAIDALPLLHEEVEYGVQHLRPYPNALIQAPGPTDDAAILARIAVASQY